jgi:hypothetical protein
MWQRQIDSAAYVHGLGRHAQPVAREKTFARGLVYVSRGDILTLNVAKPRQNVEAILNSYELFIYGDIGYFTNSF